MNDSQQTMIRYLLGELSEGEQSALEAQYFADPRAFDEMTRAETALVDDYVRGRLSADIRRRFEQTYLADARRRDRVRFAEALAARVDQAAAAPSGQDERRPLTEERESGSGWWSWLGMPWGSKPALGFAVATLLIVSTGIWLAIDSSRGRQQAPPLDVRREEPERRTPEADATEQARAGQTETEPLAPAADQPLPQTLPTPERPRAPSIVTLVLAVNLGERGQDDSRPPTLVIPPGTSEVRLQLRLREQDYASYRVVLRAIGGPEILRRADIQPRAEGADAVLTLSVPASRFTIGDYMLTLQGAAGGDRFDDLSQSIFRVEEK